jgi:signal recognition particle subunit SRP54
MHRGMADMMKAMGSGKRGALGGLGQMLGFGAGAQPTPEQMAELAKKLPGGLPPNIPGMPGSGPGLPNFPGAPGGLPGLGGGKFPGLPGLPPGFGKKK